MRILAKVRFKNAEMFHARKAAGLTMERLSELTGYNVQALYEFEGFRGYPRRVYERLSEVRTAVAMAKLDKLLSALGKPYDAVFPEVYRQAVDRKLGRPAERVYTVLELAPWQQQANLLPSPEDAYVQVELADHVERAMETLSEREATVLRMRYGLGGIGEHSLDEIGAHFGVSRERIRQNELKALCKLKHPSRSKYLKSFKEVIS